MPGMRSRRCTYLGIHLGFEVARGALEALADNDCANSNNPVLDMLAEPCMNPDLAPLCLYYKTHRRSKHVFKLAPGGVGVLYELLGKLGECNNTAQVRKR